MFALKPNFPYRYAVVNDEIRDAISADFARVRKKGRKRIRPSITCAAEKAGLSQSFIGSFESIPWNPTLDTPLRICGALDLDFAWVFRRASEGVKGQHRTGTSRSTKF